MRAAIRVILIIAGLFLPVLVASAPPPVAAATPDVTIWKTVDLATANPGDILTYTIYVNNLGPDIAPRIYVNDTLPTGTTYRGSTVVADIGAPPFYNESVLGNTVRWQFRSYPAGNASFRVFAQVESSVSDGDVLRNVAALWYTNATGVPQPVRSTTATTTVSIPVISVAKTGTFTAADAITYTITVTNVGSGSAASLWLNDTLPPGVTYVNIRPQAGSLGLTCAYAAPRLECVGRNPVVPFGPDPKVWLLDVSIDSPLPPGTVLVNWVFVNYTDDDGAYLKEARASCSLTVQTANIQVAKIVDATVIPPGGTITYTIFYTNNGQMSARDVWINDTLPLSQSLPAVIVVSANPALTVNTTTVVRWLLSNVAPGNHSATLLVRTLASLGDGTRLVNSVALNYTNADGRERPGSLSSAVTTISLNVPSFNVTWVARPLQVEPGGAISYTLHYDNKRPALAAFVVIEVFFVPTVPLSSADPLYTSTGPGKYIWNLTNVGSGDHLINITVSVPRSTVEGTVVRATAFVNYTDERGNHLPGIQVPVDVVVFVPLNVLYIVIAIGVVVALVAVLVVVRRRLAAADETVIDEVFLLHRDGLLIKHYTRRLKPDVDSDVLSGMLIAVQNFVNESFIGDAGLKKEGQLDEMKFGQYRILLSRGKSVIVAAVISGPRVEKVPGQIRAAIDDLEGSLGSVLETWEGDMETVSGADRFMQDLIAGKYRARVKLPRANR